MPGVSQMQRPRTQSPRLLSLLTPIASSGSSQNHPEVNARKLEGVIVFAKSYYTHGLLQGKNTNEKELKEETHRAESRGIPKAKLPLSSG